MMLAKAILKIETERKEYEAGSLEYLIAQHLLEFCKADPSAAKTIATTDKVIKDCSKQMWDYARKNKTANGFFMPPDMERKLIRDFYELDSINTNKSQQQSEPETGVVIDIMGLLAD